ncbi:hypothetical protein TI01_0421 [Lysobacter sp. A03]|nr:hypothetical protein TI01_0421 [Lysobacter sp. A03]
MPVKAAYQLGSGHLRSFAVPPTCMRGILSRAAALRRPPFYPTESAPCVSSRPC